MDLEFTSAVELIFYFMFVGFGMAITLAFVVYFIAPDTWGLDDLSDA